ncbi:MAG: hypothetical protein IPG87_19770 [Saprospiraceae bacterium]|nr:hypothetical protein [Candidatus Vicinibacter affinis]
MSSLQISHHSKPSSRRRNGWKWLLTPVCAEGMTSSSTLVDLAVHELLFPSTAPCALQQLLDLNSRENNAINTASGTRFEQRTPAN